MIGASRPPRGMAGPGPGPRTPAPGPRILWGSPLPPTRSGVADYASEILPHLACATDVALLEPPGWEPPAGERWLAGLASFPHDALTPVGFVPLLHLGNNPYHLWVARRLRASGGIVVLHDSVLHHLLVEEAADDGNWSRFAAELAEAEGPGGAAVALGRRWGYAGRLEPFLFPARRAYLRFASGVIVHNRQAEADVRWACPDVPVRCVPLAVAQLPPGDHDLWRARLGVAPSDLLMVHLGFLTRAKGLDVVLRSLVALGEIGVAARLVMVGEGSERGALEASVASAGLAERVRIWGYATPEALGGILGAADLGLVPRYPTAGETSAAVLRFLSAGTPAAVAGYRQFLEIPASAAPRVSPGSAGVSDLVRVAALLAGSEEARKSSRAAAKDTWQRGGHEPSRAAAAMLAAVGEMSHVV